MENNYHQNNLVSPVLDVLLDGPSPVAGSSVLCRIIFDAVVASLNNHLQASFFCTICTRQL
jgi:hypothetical protein